MNTMPFHTSETPNNLPRFVELTQTNGKKTYVRDDLLDLDSSTKESFGTRLKLKTAKHPMVAFNGFLDVQESQEEIISLINNAPTTLVFLNVTDTLACDREVIKADQVDMVVVSNSGSSTPIINVFNKDGRLAYQTFINPITDPNNLPKKADVIELRGPSLDF